MYVLSFLLFLLYLIFFPMPSLSSFLSSLCPYLRFSLILPPSTPPYTYSSSPPCTHTPPPPHPTPLKSPCTSPSLLPCHIIPLSSHKLTLFSFPASSSLSMYSQERSTPLEQQSLRSALTRSPQRRTLIIKHRPVGKSLKP